MLMVTMLLICFRICTQHLPSPRQVVYYIFAMVGMELFKGKVLFFSKDSNDPAKLYCGNPQLKDTAFAQLNYCKNNFNDVVSSFILLVELTVVNQWHDILCDTRQREKLQLACLHCHREPCLS